MPYVEPYILADSILGKLRIEEKFRFHLNEVQDLSANSNAIRSAIQQLEGDQYIVRDSTTDHWYLLTGRGSSFAATNGYIGLFMKEQTDSLVKTNLEQSQRRANDSVTETNRLTQQNMKTTKTILIVTCIVGAISAAGTVIPLFRKCKKDRQKSEVPAQQNLSRIPLKIPVTNNPPVVHLIDSTAKKSENETKLDSVKRVKTLKTPQNR